MSYPFRSVPEPSGVISVFPHVCCSDLRHIKNFHRSYIKQIFRIDFKKYSLKTPFPAHYSTNTLV